MRTASSSRRRPGIVLLAAALGFLAFALGGCNTVKGIGTDISSAAQETERALGWE